MRTALFVNIVNSDSDLQDSSPDLNPSRTWSSIGLRLPSSP
jgi:hypothetical protein